MSALDNSAPLANAGVAYIILKDWGERGKNEGLLPLFGLNKSLEQIEDARILGAAAIADPGHRQRRRRDHAN